MALEFYQIILIIFIGILVGISISFVGQTGQGVVLPIVLIITGDVFIAIAINLLNDFITSAFVSISYLRKKQFKLKKEIWIIMIIAICVSFIGVLILMTTPLSSVYSWVIPIFIMCLGVLFMKNGFPTIETVRNIAHKLSQKFSRNKNNEEIDANELSDQLEKDFGKNDNDEIRGYIKLGTGLYYILSIFFGVYVGFNAGLFGGNSGLIFVLALVLLYGYPLKKGVGTALVLSMINGLFTFLMYQILGNMIKSQIYFDFEITLYLAIGAIASGLIFSNFVQKMSAKTMGRGIGIIIFTLGTISLIFFFLF